MPEEIRHPDGRIEHPDVRHEPTDANFRWILFILIGGTVVTAILIGLVTVLFNVTNNQLAESRKSPFPLAPTPKQPLPAEPRLEQLDRMSKNTLPEVYRQQQANMEALFSYGPGEEKGFVHIPIDKAMKLLANKLPAQSSTQQQRQNGLLDGGEPNSGRLFNKKGPP